MHNYTLSSAGAAASEGLLFGYATGTLDSWLAVLGMVAAVQHVYAGSSTRRLSTAALVYSLLGDACAAYVFWSAYTMNAVLYGISAALSAVVLVKKLIPSLTRTTARTDFLPLHTATITTTATAVSAATKSSSRTTRQDVLVYLSPLLYVVAGRILAQYYLVEGLSSTEKYVYTVVQPIVLGAVIGFQHIQSTLTRRVTDLDNNAADDDDDVYNFVTTLQIRGIVHAGYIVLVQIAYFVMHAFSGGDIDTLCGIVAAVVYIQLQLLVM